MNKKIIYISIFLIGVAVNLYNFTDLFGDTAIPKVRLFGNSTTLSDSTNYINFSKGINIPNDSLKVGKYLFVGGKGGGIYLDTNKAGEILYNGDDLMFTNNKDSARIDFNMQVESEFRVINTTLDSALFKVNTAGESHLYGGLTIGTVTLTSQLKLPSDTASDYTAGNTITLNRQTGKITTKSLTTASDGFYTFTWVNSLISPTTKIWTNWSGGTESAGRPYVYKVTAGSGSATIILLNLTGAGSFNGTVTLDVGLFN